MEVMLCYYKAQTEPMKDNMTKETHKIWQQRNPNVRANIDSNKIASQRRCIEKNDKLTTIEIDQIKTVIEQEIHYMSDHTIEHNAADIEDHEGQNEAVIEDHDNQNEEVQY